MLDRQALALSTRVGRAFLLEQEVVELEAGRVDLVVLLHYSLEFVRAAVFIRLQPVRSHVFRYMTCLSKSQGGYIMMMPLSK